jgi:hypothetical protein
MLSQPTYQDAQRAQAAVVTIGLFTVVSVGIVGCIALVLTLFYLLVSFVLLVLRAIVEAFSGIASVWVNADSVLKLMILVAVVYGGYCLYRYRIAKGASRESSL